MGLLVVAAAIVAFAAATVVFERKSRSAVRMAVQAAERLEAAARRQEIVAAIM